MSDYDYDDRRSSRRHGRTRAPEYIETEETYITKGTGNRDLVLRSRGDRDRDDDYDRGYYDRQRARSSGNGRRDRDYDDDYYSDYDDRSRRGRRSRYDDDQSRYSDDDRPRKRSKSRVRELIDGAGLGGIVAAVTGGRSKSRRRRGSGDSDRSDYSRRSSSRHKDTARKWQQAASAAVITGVIEAVRSRKEAGPWTGEKGQRVATAALSAAGIDGFLDRNPHEKSKRHVVESVIGGLVASRVANGARSKSRSGDSRGRSQSRDGSQSIMGRLRSRSRSVFGRGRSASRGSDDGRGRARSKSRGIKELAAVGGVAAIGKAIYDRVRSKSRGRLNRSRSRSVDSEDSYVPSRQQRYGRSRNGPDREDGQGEADRGRGAERSPDGEEGPRGRSSSSSSASTTDLENQRRKTRTKELLTAGLATVATIHAAHGVYNSMVASDKRHKLVMEHKISPEEARKRKSKNMLQDAAAVGIAALGIKSAFSEWKEMSESRKEKHELEARRRRHQKQRERKAREMKQSGGNAGYGYAYGGYPPAGPGYADANPYQFYGSQSYAGNLPPPPVGR